MTDQNELSDRLTGLLRKISQDSLTIARDNPDYLFYVDLERVGFAGRTVYVHTKPCLASEFFITRAGWDYLTEHKPSVQPDQTRFEQVAEDYPDIANMIERELPSIIGRINKVIIESQVRRDLRVAIAEIADLQERNELNSEKMGS